MRKSVFVSTVNNGRIRVGSLRLTYLFFLSFTSTVLSFRGLLFLLWLLVERALLCSYGFDSFVCVPSAGAPASGCDRSIHAVGATRPAPDRSDLVHFPSARGLGYRCLVHLCGCVASSGCFSVATLAAQLRALMYRTAHRVAPQPGVSSAF